MSTITSGQQALAYSFDPILKVQETGMGSQQHKAVLASCLISSKLQRLTKLHDIQLTHRDLPALPISPSGRSPDIEDSFLVYTTV